MKLKRDLFARKDYYYLSQSEAESLNKKRNLLAKELLERRRNINKDISSYNSVPGADIKHNESVRSANYKYALRDAKRAAEDLRNEALNNSTSTVIGKETNSYARKPKKVSKPKSKTKVENLNKDNLGNNIKPSKDSLFNGSINPTKWSRKAKIGAGITGGLALAGTGAYLYNKIKKNKKKREEPEESTFSEKLYSQSFMTRFKGNKELRVSLEKWSKVKNIDPSIFNDCVDFKKYDKVIQSYLSWLKDNISSSDEPIDFSGRRLVLISYNKILDRVLKDKPSFLGEKMPKEFRVVIGWVDAGDGVIVLSYNVEKNKLVLNKEHLKWQIISNGINKLFNYKEEIILDPSSLFSTILGISKFIR